MHEVFQTSSLQQGADDVSVKNTSFDDEGTKTHQYVGDKIPMVTILLIILIIIIIVVVVVIINIIIIIITTIIVI